MSFRDRQQQRVLLPFGLDYADINQIKQGERLEIQLPINGPLTKHEEEATKQFLVVSDLMKNSSFYTGSLKSLRHHIDKSSSGKSNKSTDTQNVFLEGGVNDGIKRYSDRYRKQIKVGRSINDHPFIMEFFPDELHGVMISKKSKKMKKKSLFLSSYSKGEGKDIGNMIKLSEEEKQKEMLQRLNNVDENDDAVEEEVEEEDEQFEEDDDDDYNAEKYFDDGDDDFGEEDDGNDEAAF
ncbi:unnamed protein product [Ambrosiozyma monospora]|uniref:DNA-directed RNA polymerase III subunit n=2 Tax=Ambrosiozyma monospora TaxID=43982 RepID=A0A9W6T7N7_AMBMO|nr:unnamed protein product [Ambrosiozyma monospora]